MSYNLNTWSTTPLTEDGIYTVGDIGAKIGYDINKDLSVLAATVAVTFLARTPSGVSKSWTATITPAAATSARHSAVYTTVSGDLSEAGVWRLTPVLSWSSGASTVSLTPLIFKVRAANQ